jgi:uncharacterized protein YecE (DUF72 family)
MPELRIGCSGFNYWDWKGNFYPPDLPQRKWFEYYYYGYAPRNAKELIGMVK